MDESFVVGAEVRYIWDGGFWERQQVCEAFVEGVVKVGVDGVGKCADPCFTAWAGDVVTCGDWSGEDGVGGREGGRRGWGWGN